MKLKTRVFIFVFILSDLTGQKRLKKWGNLDLSFHFFFSNKQTHLGSGHTGSVGSVQKKKKKSNWTKNGSVRMGHTVIEPKKKKHPAPRGWLKAAAADACVYTATTIFFFLTEARKSRFRGSLGCIYPGITHPWKLHSFEATLKMH